MTAIMRSITITEEQDKWLDEDSISLSRLIQKHLDKLMLEEITKTVHIQI